MDWKSDGFGGGHLLYSSHRLSHTNLSRTRCGDRHSAMTDVPLTLQSAGWDAYKSPSGKSTGRAPLAILTFQGRRHRVGL